ncbi:membrane protein [Xenorhabdus szentirmaii]|nr:membrane protein [Xenorhabdus szentirmaii]
MTMKRTKEINRDAFRKAWKSYRLAPVAIAVSAVFMLSACEQSDETVSLYTNADECSQANPSQSEQCKTAYNTALKEAEKTAPKYATREECVAEFGEQQCTQTPTQAGVGQAQAQSSGGSFWMPLMAGYMMGRLMGEWVAVLHHHNPCSLQNQPAARPMVNLLMQRAKVMAQPLPVAAA